MNNFNFNIITKSLISFKGTEKEKKTCTKINYNNYSRDEFERKLEEGKSLTDLKKEYDTKLSTIRQILKHFGLKTQESKKLEKIDINQVKEMINDGCTQKQIADFIGVTTATLTSFMRKNNLLTSQREQILSLKKEDWARYLENGYRIADIAAEFNITTPIISKILKELGLTNNQSHIQDSELPIAEIIEMYKANEPIQKISNKYRITPSRINAIVKKNGIKLHCEERQERYPSKETLSKLISKNISSKEISRMYNVSESTIWRLIEKYELKELRKANSYGKEPDIQELAALVQEKLSIDEIAERLNIKPSTILKYLRIDEQKVFAGKEKVRFCYENVANLLYSGDSAVQIAEVTGKSVDSVKEKLQEFITKIKAHPNKILRWYPEIDIKAIEIPKDKKSPSKDVLIRWIQEKQPPNYKELAKSLNISLSSARYLCEKYDLEYLFDK